MRKVIEAVEDKWVVVSKDKLTDKQIKYFNACDALRDTKEREYVKVNYSRLNNKRVGESSEIWKVTPDEEYPGEYTIRNMRNNTKRGSYDKSELDDAERDCWKLNNGIKDYLVTGIIIYKDDSYQDMSVRVEARNEADAKNIAVREYKNRGRLRDIHIREVE